ncbi:MAG: radical SAM protein [Desulfurococcales archaeon ex4484_204]|nr:MAG: radical SAM protein [Desulfurococcales archaeon ex4484_204]
MPKYVFGPVPSRRLGTSLGINNVPYKHCTYSCIYCQLGRTSVLTIKRKAFFKWDDIVAEVVKAADSYEGKIDYATLVPDGEPTLDLNVGKIIVGVKEAGLRVAVLTNGSLLWDEGVREDLMDADLVSLKVDASTEEVFRVINRPYKSLRLGSVLEGMKLFRNEFRGDVITETMLIDGVNDFGEGIKGIAGIVKSLEPRKAYVAVPTRPPAEPWVKPAPEKRVVAAYVEFSGVLGEGRVELLIRPEEGFFGTAGAGDPIEGLLNIVAVHPLRIEYAEEILSREGLEPSKVLRGLELEGRVAFIDYMGSRYVTLPTHVARPKA